MSMIAVYIVTNIANGKQYVGITTNLKRRWHQHLSANGSAPALHAAIKKYGPEGFVLSHICDAFDFDAACDIERSLIQQHNTKAPNGYNLTDGGEGVVGRTISNDEKESKRKTAIAVMASLSPEERSEKFGTKNRVWSPEQIEKIRASNIGKNIGKFPSEETRLKMSASQKKRPRRQVSEETKEKIRQSLLGRKLSEETKAKIRASNIATKALLKAKKLSEEGLQNV